MSSQPKITSKNLSYSTDLPPFLAKLRGQQEQQRTSDSPDPILAARRRAARPRSASEEAEDAPLVVDEAGNAIAFPSAEAQARDGASSSIDDGAGTGADEKKDGQKEREKVAAIGASKKRKVGRVVGGGGGDDDDGEDDPAHAATTARTEKYIPSQNKSKRETKHAAADPNPKDAKSGSKQGNKKKAKKIKLSFGDDGD